jgi:hypothetical protein
MYHKHMNVFSRSLFNINSFAGDPKLTMLEGIAVFHNAQLQLHRKEEELTDEELEDTNLTPYGSEADIIADHYPNLHGRDFIAFAQKLFAERHFDGVGCCYFSRTEENAKGAIPLAEI